MTLGVMTTWQDYLHQRGISDATIAEYALSGSATSIDIPYFDARGVYRASAKRMLDGSDPKYRWPAKVERHLYNVRDAGLSPVYLTEGEFDCLILKQLGYNAVGVPGVKNFKDEWAWLFEGAEVHIFFDADPPKVQPNGQVMRAGQDAARRLYYTLNGHASRVRVIELPEGEDVTTLYLSGRLPEVMAE